MGRPCRTDNRIKFTTTIEETILENIKIKAVKERLNVNDILEKLILDYLK